jgi:Leucine-rich repeat (LRR) protein
MFHSGNQLVTLPTEICFLTQLKKLYLQENMLEYIPDLFRTLKKLKELNISNNKFTKFPDVIFTLKSVEILDISCNNFDQLPLKLSYLRSLINFNINECQFTEDPGRVLNIMKNWVNITGIKLFILVLFPYYLSIINFCYYYLYTYWML